MRPRIRTAVTLAALAGTLPAAHAQVDPSAPACGAKSALFVSERGLKLWVTKAGLLEKENPLLPLSRERVVVLQVVVNGRLGTAYGTSPDALRAGEAPAQLEKEGGSPIRWEAEPALPPQIRVVSEDGAPVLGPLRFAECGEAPVVAAAKRGDAKASSRRPTSAGGAGARPDPAWMPQGALPGLDLPKPGAN